MSAVVKGPPGLRLLPLVICAVAMAGCDSGLLRPPENSPPMIDSLAATPAATSPGSAVTVTCAARDADGHALTYTWRASGGTVTGMGASVTWSADVAGTYTITCAVSDGQAEVERQVQVVVALDDPNDFAGLWDLGTLQFDGTWWWCEDYLLDDLPPEEGEEPWSDLLESARLETAGDRECGTATLTGMWAQGHQREQSISGTYERDGDHVGLTLSYTDEDFDWGELSWGFTLDLQMHGDRISGTARYTYELSAGGHHIVLQSVTAVAPVSGVRSPPQ